MDTTERLHDQIHGALSPRDATVTTEQCDGWLVISKFMLPKPAVPPYAYQYGYNQFDHMSDADEHYRAVADGEYGGWEPVGIVPTIRGIPLGSKRILP